MVRKVQITVPSDQTDALLVELQGSENVHNLMVFESKSGSCLIMFNSVEKHLSATLKKLESHGLGNQYGSIDVLALQMSYPSLSKVKDKNYKRKYRVSDRQTVREIEDMIDAGSHMTFDFVAMVVVAGLIAAIGLLTDSAVTVVASMLVSPLMGPILCFTYGVSVQNGHMMKLGLRNEVVGVLICSVVGCVVGLVCALLVYPVAGENTIDLLTTSFEMQSRGRLVSLLVGFFAAAPSGVGVALAVTNTSINALVGVAISASLLPPVVNAGICAVIGLVHHFLGREDHRDSYLHAGGISFGLFVLNFCTISIFAFCTFRIKGIHSHAREFKDKDNTGAAKNDKVSTVVAVHKSTNL